MPADELAALRHEMDSLDLGLRELLLRRLALAKKIKAVKKRQGLEAKDEAREREIISQVLKGTSDLDARRYLKRIFKALFL